MSKFFEGFGALALLGAAGASDRGADLGAVAIGVAVALLMICFGVVVGKAKKKRTPGLEQSRRAQDRAI